MAAQDNAYYIAPANPFQALMSGAQGYESGQKRASEAELKQGRLEAVDALQSGGDIRSPLAKLIGIGDTKGAEAIATFAKNQADQQFHQQSLGLQGQQIAESGRHNKALEGQAGATLAETRRQHDFSALQPVKVGVDSFGADIYAKRNPQTGGYERIDIKGLSGQPSTAVQPDGQPATKLSGEDYLKTVDPEQAGMIRKIANYEMDPRNSSIKGGHRERIMSAVAQFDPTYDAATFPARAQAVKAFSTGPQGNAVRSFDVAVDHLHTVRELAAAMENGDTRIINSLRNKFRDQFGYDAPSNFDAAKSIVAAEITKAIVGGNSALADREELRAPLNNSKSFGQLAGVIDKVYKPLMAGQLQGLKKQYEDTTKRKDFNDRLREQTRAELIGKEGGASSGAPAATTQSGVRWSISP